MDTRVYQYYWGYAEPEHHHVHCRPLRPVLTLRTLRTKFMLSLFTFYKILFLVLKYNYRNNFR